jgi:hypothetical protein
MTRPHRFRDETLGQVLARTHALRVSVDALYRASQTRLQESEERMQRVRQQLILSRLLLQEVRARLQAASHDRERRTSHPQS